MLILNWNVKWATPRSRRWPLLQQQIRALAPEIVCLTEAAAKLLPGEGFEITSAAGYGYPAAAGRRKVLLWSQRPWHDVLQEGPPSMPPGRYVYGVTETSLGPLGVHGVCIPWSFAHVSTGQKNRARWQEHLAYLKALPGCLRRQKQSTQIIIGNFNQRIPRRSAPPPVFQALQAALDGRFMVITAGMLRPAGAQTVDHIATNFGLRSGPVRTLSERGPDGQALSDHPGITAELYPVCFQ